jgi:hypothetical protein
VNVGQARMDFGDALHRARGIMPVTTASTVSHIDQLLIRSYENGTRVPSANSVDRLLRTYRADSATRTGVWSLYEDCWNDRKHWISEVDELRDRVATLTAKLNIAQRIQDRLTGKANGNAPDLPLYVTVPEINDLRRVLAELERDRDGNAHVIGAILRATKHIADQGREQCRRTMPPRPTKQIPSDWPIPN